MNNWRAILGCVLTAVLAAGADWPQWGRTDNRNPISDETGLPSSFEPGTRNPATGQIDLSAAKNVRWAVKLGGSCYSNPTVAGGRVFVGSDDLTIDEDPRFDRVGGGMVKCFDEATGALLWQLLTPIRTNLPKTAHFNHQKLGTCSSPTIEGDRVYVVSSAGEILCLDVHGQANGNDGPFVDEAKHMVPPGVAPINLGSHDADILWRFDPIDALGVQPHDSAACSILIHGNVLYVSTSNGMGHDHETMPAPEAPAIIALDKRTGKLVATEDEKLSSRIYHAQWCSPSLGVVNGKTLIFFGGGDGVLYAFESIEEVPEQPVKLKKVFSYDCNPPQFRFHPDGRPIRYMDGDKLLNRSGPNNNDGLYVGPNDVIATPTFVDGRIYVAIGRDPTDGRGRGMFHCIDATKTGDITQTGRIWTYDALDRTTATAVVANGLVYLPDFAGRIHCLDADSGKVQWVHESGAETWGGALAADGKLYIGNKRELLVMAQGKQPKILSTIRLGGAIYGTPIAANGTLFVATNRTMWAVQEKR
jgi:outer membrane protein assembly factor BamB